MKLAGVTFQARSRCGSCGATGVTPSEAWADFARWRDRHGRIGERGDLVNEYFLDVRGFDAIPDQSDVCGDCENGYVVVDVPAEDLRDWLLEAVQRPVLNARELGDLEKQLRRKLSAAAAKSDGLGVNQTEASREQLRVMQEAAETLRSVRALGPVPRDDR